MKNFALLILAMVSGGMAGALILYAVLKTQTIGLETAWVGRIVNDDGSISISLHGPGNSTETYLESESDARLEEWTLQSLLGTSNSLFYSIKVPPDPSSPMTRSLIIGEIAECALGMREFDLNRDRRIDRREVEFFLEGDLVPSRGYVDMNADGEFDIFWRRQNEGSAIYVLFNDGWTRTEQESIASLSEGSAVTSPDNGSSLLRFDYQVGKWLLARPASTTENNESQ